MNVSSSASTNTLSIGITGELAHNHNEICEFLSKLHEYHCREMNISLLLLSTYSDGRLIPLLTTFSKKGLVFNQVVMTQDEQRINIAQVMSPDIIMTTNREFAEQCKSVNLPSVLLDELQSHRTIGDSLHFAFDGDAVLFCHNAQLVADSDGIDAFEQHEETHAEVVMGKGRLFNFINKIDVLQQVHRHIKWSLVTARGGKALKRAMHTIEAWNLHPSQCFFMEGSDKTPILKSINSDIFFDDHPNHCKRASGHMLVGHVQVSVKS
jgi:5'-nucleotidase